MTTSEYRYWSSEQRFESLLAELMPLDLGAWWIEEVTAVLGTLGWDLVPTKPGGQADLARGPLAGARWRLGNPPRGPRQGVGVVTVSDLNSAKVTAVEINLGHGIRWSDDHDDVVDFMRSACELVENAVGAPPTVWAGPGPKVLWRRPGTSLAVWVELGSPIFALLNTAYDNDAAGRPHGIWRAAAPADLGSPEPRPAPPRTWAAVRTQLAIALRALCADAPDIPAGFTLHLQSGRDRSRCVSAWNDGADLRIEAFDHDADPVVDPDRFVRHGRPGGESQGRQCFPDAQCEPAHAGTAATRLVNTLESMGVHVDDLAYHGTVSGLGRRLELELPDLTLPRIVDPLG